MLILIKLNDLHRDISSIFKIQIVATSIANSIGIF